jgi:hypothetical protein
MKNENNDKHNDNINNKPYKTNDMGIDICCENCVDKMPYPNSMLCKACIQDDFCHFYPADYAMERRIYKLQQMLKDQQQQHHGND